MNKLYDSKEGQKTTIKRQMKQINKNDAKYKINNK